jgi:hypothetical protein
MTIPFDFLLFLFAWFICTFPASNHQAVLLRTAFVILALFFPLIAPAAQFLHNTPYCTMAVVVSQIGCYLLFLYGSPVTCSSACPGAVSAMHIQAIRAGPVFVKFTHIFPRKAFDAEFLLAAVKLTMRVFILLLSVNFLFFMRVLSTRLT